MKNYNTGFSKFLDDLKEEMESDIDYSTDIQTVKEEEEEMKVNLHPSTQQMVDELIEINPILGKAVQLACRVSYLKGWNDKTAEDRWLAEDMRQAAEVL